MRNVEGVRLIGSDSGPRFLGSPENITLSLGRARTPDNTTRQVAVGVLSLRRAPKLGKLLVCFTSIRSSCDLRPPPNRKGPGPRRPHRCSWISFPDIFGAPGRGRRDCVNPIQRSHELDLHSLHQHATEEEDFGGSRSVHVTSATVGANGWWNGRRRKNGRRRGSS